MATIKIPTPLRAYTEGQTEISVSGDNVAAALDDLTNQYPELRRHLFDGDKLRGFVNVFIGDEDIRFRGGLEAAVESDSRLRIVPSVAGGCVS